jgi:hypothetical protein
MNQNRKIVWVLGSGFSVPLGGPTLNSLLSRASKDVIEMVFPEDRYPKLYEGGYFATSFNIFGLGLSPRNKTFPQMWADAEQYLDDLDTAVSSPEGPAAARLKSVIRHANFPSKIDFLSLANTTHRIIAAECSAFLEDKNIEFEIWQPYIRWAKMLDYNHTIITFNYDRVLETLAGINKIQWFGLNSFVGIIGHNQEMATKVQQIALAVKLHGSIDWKKNESQSPHDIERGEPVEALICDPDQLVIATPGPTKHGMVSGTLGKHWKIAEEALSKADVVFFIGYRFPQTDAEARGRLLGALMKNESPDLRLYTVLGPENNPDSQRLEALLNYATKGKAKVTRLPLWAQDFMSVCNPDFIFE